MVNFEEFLAGFWRVSGETLAGLTERKRVSTEIRDGHALEAFRLFKRHALVTFQAVLDQLVEGSQRLGSCGGTLWSRFALLCQVLEARAQKVPTVLFCKRRGVTKVCL